MSTRSRVGDVLGVAVGPDVERDDDRIRRRRQQHVGLVHRADAGVNDPDLDLLVGQLRQRVGEHLGRSLHVGLDDDRQLLHAAFGDLRLQRLEREPAALGAERAVLRLLLAERRDLPRLGGVGHLEDVARLRQPGRARALRPASTGPRTCVGRPRSSMSARTRPTIGPAMKVSPTFSVPSCTSTVATGPRPLSSFASSTVPVALRFGFALSSPMSLTSRIISSSRSMFVFFVRRLRP